MIHTPIFFWLSIAALVVASYFHIRSSQNFLWYGQTESNPLWKDKFGFFDARKYVIFLVVFVAAVSAIHLAWMGYQTGIVFYIMAGAFAVMTVLNNSGAKKNRQKQIALLTELLALAKDGRTEPIDPAINTVFRSNPIVNKGGRAFYKLFGWLWIDNPGQLESIVPLREKIIAHAQRPSAEWFPQ